MNRLDSNKERHPSYGTIQVSRGQVGMKGAPLFGSPFLHHNIIDITVFEAVKWRHLHEDHIHGERELLQVSMSETQFAQMLTTMNCGTGVPCTIQHVQGKPRPDPPRENLKEVFAGELKAEIQDLYQEAKELNALTNQSKWNAEDKRKMRDLASGIEATLRSNLEFFQKQFEERMAEVVAQAKAEVDAFVSAAVTRTGLTQLKHTAPRLEGTPPERTESQPTP